MCLNKLFACTIISYKLTYKFDINRIADCFSSDMRSYSSLSLLSLFFVLCKILYKYKLC